MSRSSNINRKCVGKSMEISQVSRECPGYVSRVYAVSSPEERSSLLAILAEESARLPPFLRILITSRTQADIMSAFSVHPHIHAQMLNLSSESNNQDLKLYITCCMSKVTINFRY